MAWARILAYVTGTVDQELLARSVGKAMKDRNSNQRRSIPRSNCQEPRIDISTIRVYYPNAHYSFDVPVESNVRAGDKMHHPAYDPAAAPAAEARTKAFDKLLRVS